MDDFQKKLYQAKMARMQGVHSLNRDTSRRNIIEESINGPVPINQKFHEVPEVQKAPVQKSNYGSFLKKFFIGLFVIIMVLGIGLGSKIVFNYKLNTKQQTADNVIEAVGKLVTLPENETPTVATVTELEPLKDQAFFKDAMIGDKVLVYKTSSKAILYRPSTNKVVNVSSLN